jgi:hypothetical protein
MAETTNCLVSKLLLAVNGVGNALGRSCHLLNLLWELSKFLYTRPPMLYLELGSLSKWLRCSDFKHIRILLLRFLKDFLVVFLLRRDFELFGCLLFGRLIHRILE